MVKPRIAPDRSAESQLEIRIESANERELTQMLLGILCYNCRRFIELSKPWPYADLKAYLVGPCPTKIILIST
ncbi:MAG: hypothetical protein AB2699_11140, partial [Candidatus Thiodiazotropha taylori]